jgi:hypothetical protein
VAREQPPDSLWDEDENAGVTVDDAGDDADVPSPPPRPACR